MAYYLPSFLQKRVLRYALSRLDILDARDLDLDNLEIAWGKRSTFELRDLGLSTHKLSALLQLPPALTLAKARILLLRVTVPADLYKSSILIEVDGFNVRLDTDAKEEKADKHGPTLKDAGPRGQKEDVKVGRSRSTRATKHVPGRFESAMDEFEDSSDDDDPVRVLPSTVDIAQSFLQAEPPRERAALQAAVAESQDIDESQVLSESTGDTTALGVGGGISLPGFLADFLKGVTDRIQVCITNIHISLDTQLELPAEVIDAPGGGAKWENLTLKFCVAKVEIDGTIASLSTVDPKMTNKAGELRVEEDLASRPGQAVHRISVRNIQGMVVSDTSLFTNLSRFSVPPSPYATQSNFSKPSNDKGKTSAEGSNPALPDESPRAQKLGHFSSTESDRLNPLNSSSMGDDVESIDKADEANSSFRLPGTGNDFDSGESQYQDSVLTGSFYSNLEDSDPNVKSHAGQAVTRETRSQYRMETPVSTAQTANVYRDAQSALFDKSSDPLESGSGGVPESMEDVDENLAESKIFSHEEAQSMYLSAMSQRSRQSGRSRHNIPGNWDSSSSEGETFTTPTSGVGQPPLDQAHATPSELESSSIVTTGMEKTGSPTDVLQGNTNPGTDLQGPAVLESEKPAAEPFSQIDQTFLENSERSSEKSDTGLFILKKIIYLDSLTLEIPQEYDPPIKDSALSTRSGQPFSCGVSGSSHEDHSQARMQDAHQANGLGDSSHADLSADGKGSDRSTSLRLGSISILGDIGLTKLTIMLAQRFMDIAKQKSQTKKATDPLADLHFNIRIAVSKISWQFLDVVRGFTTSESQSLSSEARSAPMPEDTDVLLKAVIRDLKVSTERHGHSLLSKTSIRRFIFGYAKHTIMSFDSGLKLRESNRDILGPVDHDIILKVSESLERTHIELTTLPLHLCLDLRRLDETFSWFGGFSSILGLGSSVISTVTVTEPKPKPVATRPARVRFENTSPALQTTEAAPSLQKKITARLGGIFFDLEGNSAAFRLETSAVKLVSRAEGLGLAVDRLNLSGPYIISQSKEPSINVKLAGLRAEYLSHPKEVDLSRLLALLCPSKDNYEQDDDILLDTLLRQRRQGGIIRVNVERLDSHVGEMLELQQLPALGEDLKKLSTVAKYLPEDDRSGIMTLFLIRHAHLRVNFGCSISTVGADIRNTEAAHISLPSLVAFSLSQLDVRRNDVEEIIGIVPATRPSVGASAPMVMARFVGNELEPTVKLKLDGLRVEYHVTTVMAVLGFSDEVTTERFVSDMLSSIATVTAQPESALSPPRLSAQTSTRSDDSKPKAPPLGLDIVLRDVVVGLNPRDSVARGIIVLSTARLTVASTKEDDLSANLDVNKASILAIDDADSLIEVEASDLPAQSGLLQRLEAIGYVNLSDISAAKMILQILGSGAEKSIHVELRDTLVVLESCADSTQTLQTILNGLQPPLPPSKELKYRTQVMPVEDMLASFSGEAFAANHRDDKSSFHSSIAEAADEDAHDLEFVSSFYGFDAESEDEDVSNSMLGKGLNSLTDASITPKLERDASVDYNQDPTQAPRDDFTLDFREDHFGNNSTIGGTAHRWDTTRNTYDLTNDSKLRTSPLRLRVRGVHIIWNLFDGYDWQRTRDAIGEAVAAVEGKAIEQRSRRNKRRSLDVEEEEDSVIGDFLFNSIYIGIPSSHDPKDLSRQINRNIDDLVSESESYATSTNSSSPSRQGRAPRVRSRKLRLTRSKSHKMTFELKGLSADLVVFPPDSGEVQSSVDVRVQDLEIFDHLPSSTWKKFATYMLDAGEREAGTSMIHIELLNVKPVPDLAASEIVLKV